MTVPDGFDTYGEEVPVPAEFLVPIESEFIPPTVTLVADPGFSDEVPVGEPLLVISS